MNENNDRLRSGTRKKTVEKKRESSVFNLLTNMSTFIIRYSSLNSPERMVHLRNKCHNKHCDNNKTTLIIPVPKYKSTGYVTTKKKFCGEKTKRYTAKKNFKKRKTGIGFL
jgi:hypothetical protein